MFKYLKNYRLYLPESSINKILKNSWLVLTSVTFLTCIVAFHTINHFKINTDLTEMISDELRFRKVQKTFHKNFPALHDSIVIVIEADTPEQAREARDKLAMNLYHDKSAFKSVYIPGGGPFFQKNGLMYMNLEKLENLAERLYEVQPFIALLTQDFSLPGLFTSIEKIVGEYDEYIKNNQHLVLLFDRLSNTFAKVPQKNNYRMSWQEIFLDQGKNTITNYQIIIVQPFLDYSVAQPVSKAIKKIRNSVKELNIEEYGVKINITGRLAINYEDLLSVQKDIQIASLISIILVGIILYIGVGSIRLVFAALFTLFTGLIWTIGFAVFFIGSLNLISITFVVLFIGLGIDYSIQICLRYKELRFSGFANSEAISKGISSVSNALILCSITTAIGFYAFVPSAYVGASELGLIAGTGMLLNLLANIILLPALINLMPYKKRDYPPLFSAGSHVSKLIDNYATAIVAGAIALGIASAILMPKIDFDANPLNLSDPETESIITARKLLKSEKGTLWTISVMASDQQEARSLAKRLKELKEVETVVTFDDFIPENQNEKLDLINDMALIMPSPPDVKTEYSLDLPRNKKALEDLSRVLKESIDSAAAYDTEYVSAITRLVKNIQIFSNCLINMEKEKELFHALERAILSNLKILLDNFNDLMQAKTIELTDLPKDLVSYYLSNEGIYRIQVFPRYDISDIHNLKKFVSAVRTIAPDATDKPVTILESGKVISSAFINATILAFALIALFLRIVFKRWVEVILIMFTLLLGLIYTIATAVILDISFNFANIIVVPLLLGIGVDFSIHMLSRIKDHHQIDSHILQTSTSRAIFFSALTTITSFGVLSFIHHAGTASIGKLLSICIIFMIVSTLIVFPALLKIYNPYKK